MRIGELWPTIPSRLALLPISSSKEGPSFTLLETARAAAGPSPERLHATSVMVAVRPCLVSSSRNPAGRLMPLRQDKRSSSAIVAMVVPSGLG